MRVILKIDPDELEEDKKWRVAEHFIEVSIQFVLFTLVISQ